MCSVNPIYGQGVTIAALEALACRNAQLGCSLGAYLARASAEPRSESRRVAGGLGRTLADG